MIVVHYPEPAFKTKSEGEKKFIFDSLRKKWVKLTPEEWVRQNFIQYLLQEKKYPASLVALEKEIQLGELKKRFDLLVYDSEHRPWMLIECKAMDVKLDDSVLEQVIRYHAAVPVSYLIITNGVVTFGFSKKAGTLVPVSEMPEHNK
ncbi:MAG TPA: type I restriction enzyme HsdR N-terminal domain-containing protein [Chitinophagaceae bacterium]|jgi:hypothetical protein|nr:type I restriction enzyme HsdR N-terminal domain-containing protein [Chitinophagaceae bacterium]